jgi:hypothetical protein
MEKLPSWRRMRRAADEGFSRGSARRFYETQTTEAVFLACGWLDKPEKRAGLAFLPHYVIDDAIGPTRQSRRRKIIPSNVLTSLPSKYFVLLLRALI